MALQWTSFSNRPEEDGTNVTGNGVTSITLTDRRTGCGLLFFASPHHLVVCRVEAFRRGCELLRFSRNVVGRRHGALLGFKRSAPLETGTTEWASRRMSRLSFDFCLFVVWRPSSLPFVSANSSNTEKQRRPSFVYRRAETESRPIKDHRVNKTARRRRRRRKRRRRRRRRWKTR